MSDPPLHTERDRWHVRSARLGLAALTLALALALGECVARAHAASAGRPHDPEHARQALWLAAAGLSADLGAGQIRFQGGLGEARVVLHPYLGFDAASGLEQYEALSRRAREPEAVDDFDVFVLGGSVAALLVADAGETLTETLRADERLAGREVRVHGLGRGAFRQPQQLLQLAYLLALGLVPDAVLLVDGYNELTVNADDFAGGVHPVQPNVGYWGALVVGPKALDGGTVALRERARALAERGRARCLRFVELGLHHSALATWGMQALLRRNQVRAAESQGAYANRLRRLALEGGEGPARALLGPALSPGESALEACVRQWREGSRDLRALCEAHGVPYVHVLQPTLHDAGSKPLTDAERASGGLSEAGIAAVREGYPLLRAAGSTLAAEGEHFEDASRLFADVADTLYYDACHFTTPGSERLARAAAARLLQALP